MKKKIIALILVVFMIAPCFILNASAIITERDDNRTFCGISISDDFKTLYYYNGTKYHRFDASMTQWDYDFGEEYEKIKYNSDEIKFVDFVKNENNVIITADITLNDGSTISASYIEDIYLDEHNSLVENTTTYTVDFVYPKESQVELSSSQIFGEKTILLYNDLQTYMHFDVNAYATNDVFNIRKGFIASDNGAYYYVDYTENDMTDSDAFYYGELDSVNAYKITNTEAITALDEAYKNYNSDAIGLLTGDVTEGIGAVLLIMVFGLIPLAAFIVFLILSIRAKTPAYKKMFRAIWIISAVEIAIFVITMILLL